MKIQNCSHVNFNSNSLKNTLVNKNVSFGNTATDLEDAPYRKLKRVYHIACIAKRLKKRYAYSAAVLALAVFNETPTEHWTMYIFRHIGELFH